MITLYSLKVSLIPESRSVNAINCPVFSSLFSWRACYLMAACLDVSQTERKEKWLMYSKHHQCSNWATLGVDFVLPGNNSIIMRQSDPGQKLLVLRRPALSKEPFIHSHTRLIHSSHPHLNPEGSMEHADSFTQSWRSVSLLLGKMSKRDICNCPFSCKFAEFNATVASFEMSDFRYHSISTHMDQFRKKCKLFHEILSSMEHNIRHFKCSSCCSNACSGA